MSSSKIHVERLLLALYLLGLLAALWGAWGRIGAEKQNRTSEIVLDAEAMREWRMVLEQPVDEFEKSLISKGIASVAVGELHLDDLVEEGRVVAQSAPQFNLTLNSGALGDSAGLDSLKAKLEASEGGTYLLFKDSQLATTLTGQLKVLFGPEVTTFDGDRILWLPVSQKVLRTAGLGFNPVEVKRLAEQGFGIWLRPENRAGLTSETLQSLLKEWGSLPQVQGVVFGGALNEALGYPDKLEETASGLQSLGWRIGYIELSPGAQQDGIETLVRSLPGQTVRVMAVSPPHQAKLAPFRVLGMYSLGARERNIRLLYVRPFNVAGRPELDEEFLYSLPAELEQRGDASVFEPALSTPPSMVEMVLLCVGAGALALLLVHFMDLPVRGTLWGVLLLPLIGFGLASAIGKGVLFRALLALCVAMGAPIVSFLKWVYPALSGSRSTGVTAGVKLLILCSLASLSAGLYVAALLSDTTFLLGLDRFRGVKILTLGTPVFILGLFVLKRYSVEQIWTGLKSYVAVYQALLTGVVLALFGFLFLRTGNDAGGAASDWERTLRVVLDQALGVRPRFKEFMVAHPAMVCTPLLASRIGFLPALLPVLLAGIGQAGIVDTFAHVHTPLDVTLIRVLLGVVFGAIIGLLAGGLFSYLESSVRARWSKRQK